MDRFADYRLAGHRGAAAIEFAIVLPILLLCVLGLIEFGRAVWTQATLDYVVQTSARWAAVQCATSCPSPSTIQSRAASQSQGFGLTVDESNFPSPDTGAACGAGITGVQVTASLPFDWLVPALLPYSTTLSASACFPV